MNVLIIPSKPEGLNYFQENKSWKNIRLEKKRIAEIEYIALYQAAPIMAITHYAKVKKIQEYTNEAKTRSNKRYIIEFEDIQNDINIVLDDRTNRKLIIQSIRYTSIEKLKKSKNLSELFGEI